MNYLAIFIPGLTVAFFCFVMAMAIKSITEQYLKRRFKKLDKDDKRRKFKTRAELDAGRTAKVDIRPEQSRILPLSGLSIEDSNAREVREDSNIPRKGIFSKLGFK